jgi:ABC-type sugar transport system ATPase subunit
MANIKLDNVNKWFDDKHIIKNVSLNINSGSFTVLVGPSGCGKSTLLRMIAGLETINEGTISIDKNVVNDLEPKKRSVAMVFQSYALFPYMTVFENIAFGLTIEKRPKNEIKERVYETAKILQIEDLLKRKPKQLSGGQKQRVAIGRAIIRKPKVFLFDEPLSNLDAALRVQMRVEIARLHDQIGATMVYVTHDQTEAMTMADEIVVLDKGEVSQIGKPLNLYKNPANEFVGGFIGSPKMNLIDSKISKKSSKGFEIDCMNSINLNVQGSVDKIQIGENIRLGVRPEDLSVNSGNFKSWKGKVIIVERLGSSTFLYVEKEGEPLIAETKGESKINVGDIVEVGFDPAKCHVFNSDGLLISSY